MSTDLSELKARAALLSDAERGELALALIESLESPVEDDTDVGEAWQIEIERRVAEVERGEVQLIPGEEVFERLRQRLK